MNQPKTTRDRLDRVFAIVRRTGRFIVPALLVAIIGSGAAVGYAMARQRIYKSETLILFREGTRAGEVAAVADEPGDRAQRLGLRLKEMVLSRTRLEQIITSSRLYGDIIFDRGMVDAVEELRKHVGFRVQDGDTFGLSFEGSNPERVKDVTAKLAEA
ncbi:MAG: Lipopolysaccharide biosynthesis chain length determinant protein, partial [bacterium]|nr:Lipopolysaccharide biosynthesis chain length determinant protein [bacterium]